MSQLVGRPAAWLVCVRVWMRACVRAAGLLVAACARTQGRGLRLTATVLKLTLPGVCVSAVLLLVVLLPACLPAGQVGA